MAGRPGGPTRHKLSGYDRTPGVLHRRPVGPARWTGKDAGRRRIRPPSKPWPGSARERRRRRSRGRRGAAGVRDVRPQHAGRSASRCSSGSRRSTRSASPRSPRRSRRKWARRCRWRSAAQAPAGLAHLKQTLGVLKDYPFSRSEGHDAHPARAGRRLRADHAVELADEPDHVQGRAGARGRLHDGAEAERDRAAQRHHDRRGPARGGVPAGVFNLVNGDGPSSARRMAAHPGIDMVSFTGSTRAGIQVAKAAADTVKRVAQELGGKSANIILDDADFARMVKRGVRACFNNSGQSCNAPTRMLVPRARLDEAVAIAKETADATVVGDPQGEKTNARPGREQGAVREDPGADREGHRRGRRPRRRRPGPARRASTAATSSGRPCSPTSGTT